MKTIELNSCGSYVEIVAGCAASIPGGMNGCGNGSFSGSCGSYGSEEHYGSCGGLGACGW